MKVLRSGIKVEDWKSRVTCGTCTAELEVKAADLVLARNMAGLLYPAIQCPECQEAIGVPNVPAVVEKAVRARLAEREGTPTVRLPEPRPLPQRR